MTCVCHMDSTGGVAYVHCEDAMSLRDMALHKRDLTSFVDHVAAVLRRHYENESKSTTPYDEDECWAAYLAWHQNFYGSEGRITNFAWIGFCAAWKMSHPTAPEMSVCEKAYVNWLKRTYPKYTGDPRQHEGGLSWGTWESAWKSKP